MKKILLTGGGTGGHVYPNLALLPDLVKAGYQVEYAGGEGDAIEKRLAENAGLRYHALPTIKFDRGLSPSSVFNNVKIPLKLSRCVKAGEKLIDELSPDLVFSKGGYAALPCALAALKLGLPVICHESDLTMGLSNRLAAKRGAVVLTAHPHSDFGQFVGMPLRHELFSADREKAVGALHLEKGKPVLLVVGGSGGARAVNELIIRHLKELTRLFFVIHVYGKNGAFSPPDGVSGYLPIPYAEDIASLFAAADVVLSRAGATAVHELAALKKRAVFVPLSGGASRGDQVFNATLAEEYGAKILKENEDIDTRLLPTLKNCLISPPMSPISVDANGKILTIINATLGRGGVCKNKKP